MAYTRKTMDRWDIETNSGYGWDVEYSEYTRKAAREQLKCYRENSYGRFGTRMVKHREKITRLFCYGMKEHTPHFPDNYAAFSRDATGKYAHIIAYGRRLEEQELADSGLEFIRVEDVA